MTAFIQQPNFIPWLGYFSKIASAESFIFFDSVALSNSNTWTSRSQILVNGKSHWLSLPIHRVNRTGQKICEVELLDFKHNWNKTLRTIHHAYRRAPHFEAVYPFFENFYKENWQFLADFNCQFIESLCRKLDINTHFLQASSNLELLRSTDHKTDYIIQTCQAFDIKHYLAGQGGSLRYLEKEKFDAVGITLDFIKFQSNIYPQLNTIEFVKGLSIIDVLMNCGWDETARMLKPKVYSNHDFYIKPLLMEVA
jgi:WbqC-like protein family